MFIQRVRSYPALGKETEFRAALEELVKKLQAQGQAQGIAVSLSVQLFSPEGATFVATSRFRDLAELENRRRQTLADPAFQAAMAKLAPLSRAPAKFELYEVLIPFPS